MLARTVTSLALTAGFIALASAPALADTAIPPPRPADYCVGIYHDNQHIFLQVGDPTNPSKPLLTVPGFYFTSAQECADGLPDPMIG